LRTRTLDLNVRGSEIITLLSPRDSCDTQLNNLINLINGILFLPFGPEPSVFSVAVEEPKNYNIQDYNFACGETWSLTLSEEHRLGMLENRVLRRIFGPKREEVTGEWRKLHNKEIHDLYSSPSIIE
jgi:hypothetical protein